MRFYVHELKRLIEAAYKSPNISGYADDDNPYAEEDKQLDKFHDKKVDTIKKLNVVIDELFAAVDGDSNLVCMVFKMNRDNFLRHGLMDFFIDFKFKLKLRDESRTFTPTGEPLTSMTVKDAMKTGINAMNPYSKLKNLENLLVCFTQCVKDANKLLKNIADAPKGESPKAPLGRYAFPMERIPGGKFLPPEPNTRLEDEILANIESHFAKNDPMDMGSGNALQKLLSKGLYQDVIHEPRVEKVYRGIAVSHKWLEKMLKKKDVPHNGSINKRFKFKPRLGTSTSWSADEDEAIMFARSAISISNQYTLIITAKTDDNPNKFLAGPGGLYKLSGPSEFSSEEEETGLGSISVSHIEWTYEGHD